MKSIIPEAFVPAGPAFAPTAGLSVPQPQPEPQMRAFGDSMAARKEIYEGVMAAASGIAPMDDGRRSLALSGLRWADPERFTRAERKHAVLSGGTLGRRLKGVWTLKDNVTGEKLDEREQVVARVPYLSSMGTFAHNGTEYTVGNQQRLRAGVYARVQDNGDVESHVNVIPGQGVSHRFRLDPAKGVFKVKVGNSEAPLLPLLRAMGAADDEVREAWGNELFAANAAADDKQAMRKLSLKVLKKAQLAAPDDGQRHRLVAEAFAAMRLDPEVTRKTLGHPYDSVSRGAVLAASKRLLSLSRGEGRPDDRDALPFQTFHGPEDLFRERIERDHGGHRRAAFREASMRGTLAKMPSGLMTRQLEQAILGSGVGSALEEINPLEVFDKQTVVTRMGEGGIPSMEAIPMEARSVQPSHLGFVDPVRTPESAKAGVDLYLARGARKGKDGRVYASVTDQKTGKSVWKTPQDLAEASVATPDALNWDTERVPVMKNGRIDYVPKAEIDYVVPHFEDAWSPLANLVPFKSGVKPGRLAMGSRYMTQALPLEKPEAPLVRGLVAGGDGKTSYEEEYGRHAGAARADAPGTVIEAGPGMIKVRYDDGTDADVELYDNHPMNRKTAYTQTPVVKPGDRFDKGSLLARSNFTDEKGVVAVGANFKTAYLPWKGYNFKDAIVVSESAAKRMTSGHMYQDSLEITPNHKTGKSAFLPLFPQKFSREQLDKVGDDGAVMVGQTVEYGQPLLLAAAKREGSHGRVHRKGEAGHSDESILWEHHDPGVVTDVVWGKTGPAVAVKSTSALRPGDKLSGRYGDKGVVSAVVPDGQMPHGADGKPFEVLLSPLGVISRANPTQKIEGWLGKVARLTGEPINVADFKDIGDMTEYAHAMLRKHNISPEETLTDPSNGRKLPPVATGERFLMKLHHMAESKNQGRGGGGYTQEGAPSKGGPQGCFTGETEVECYDEDDELAYKRIDELFASWGPVPGMNGPAEITDAFSCRVDPSELVSVTLEDGSAFTCTRGHVLFLSDGTRVEAGALCEGDDLLE